MRVDLNSRMILSFIPSSFLEGTDALVSGLMHHRLAGCPNGCHMAIEPLSRGVQTKLLHKLSRIAAFF